MRKRSPGKNIRKSRKKQHKINPKSLKNLIPDKGDLIKRMQYRHNRLLGMNCYQSAIKAGYSEATARHHAHKIERVERWGIVEALENAGATNTIMARELVKIATSAMKRSQCTVEIKHENGEIIIDERAAELIPDEHLRKETWELIGKFKKQLGTGSIIPEGNYRRLVIEVERDSGIPELNEDTRRDNQVDKSAKLRVEIAKE